MKKPVFIGAFLFSLVLAALNNLFNKHSIDWIGGPDVLEKPSGWPSMGIAKGMQAGFKVAWKDFLAHEYLILGGLLAIIAILFLIRRSRSVPVAVMVRTVLRIGLGVMFLTAAWPKFASPKGFAVLVAQYQFLPHFIVNAFSLWLPAFEIVIGVGILITLWEREFSALVGLLLLMFIVALGQALVRDLGIACGCFDIEGAQDAGEAWFSLIRDVVLLVPVTWLILTGGRRYLHWPRNR
ncbi:MAG TPA: MauE/DoxX family redox-associated membrane protein [Fibrobacteria bacterium]|nr:MauE/DoxX family redox-associated membrane protein [Fibrobacteria bacterium]